MKMIVEIECIEARSPKCIARLVSVVVEEGEEEGPTAKKFERQGRGEDPLSAVDDLMLGEPRRGLQCAFGDDATACPQIVPVASSSPCSFFVPDDGASKVSP